MKKKGDFFVSYVVMDKNFNIYGRGSIVTEAVIAKMDTVITDLKRAISTDNDVPIEDIWIVSFNKI